MIVEEGVISLANREFEKLSGYSTEEIEGRKNPSAAPMLGYEIEELIGKPSHTVWHRTRPDGSPYQVDECPIYAAYRNGLVYHVDNELFWRKDGMSVYVEYTSTPNL